MAEKDSRMEELELKVTRLEELELKVARLEEIIASRKEKDVNYVIREQLVEKSAILARTCREVRAADPSLTSGMYWIDPDGQGIGDDPIYVYCDMTIGKLTIYYYR